MTSCIRGRYGTHLQRQTPGSWLGLRSHTWGSAGVVGKRPAERQLESHRAAAGHQPALQGAVEQLDWTMQCLQVLMAA